MCVCLFTEGLLDFYLFTIMIIRWECESEQRWKLTKKTNNYEKDIGGGEILSDHI